MRNRGTELVEYARALSSRTNALVEAVERELGGQTFVAASDRGLVEATADHLTRVVDIRIGRAGLHRTRGADLAEQVWQAVTRAQALARTEHQRVMRAQARRGGTP